MVVVIDPQNAGISGNMMLGALIDLGTNKKELKQIIDSVASNFGDVDVKIKKTNSYGIESVHVDVIENYEEKNKKISYKRLINKLGSLDKDDLIKNEVVEKSKDIFKRIAVSESKIHGKSLDNIHFHEVGAVDGIVDVLGSVYSYYWLGFNDEKVIGLPPALGGGTTDSSHGKIPIPAPATLDILKNVKCFGGPVKRELTTPTGSAIYVELCNDFQQFQPIMEVKNIGYGSGSKDLGFPNVLRIIKGSSDLEFEKVDVIETNVDHLNGELLGYLFEKLIGIGASDVSITPTIMKKNRPGHIIKVISTSEKTDNIISAIYEETGTLGIRVSKQIHRGTIKRKIISIDVDLGKYLNTSDIRSIRFKLGMMGNKIISQRREYEDIKKLAQDYGLTLMKAEKIVENEFMEFLNNSLDL
ncbi:MAG: nickel pincer cofactor biosynthesis protein LarC [Methanobrevibacter sp.]|nr:nickel pincer cofactor biosynthesis protein LarC [Candidatus Methanovirga aequatorialis]